MIPMFTTIRNDPALSFPFLLGSVTLLHSELPPGSERPGHLWIRAGRGRRVHLPSDRQQRPHVSRMDHAEG